jgi:hypothetical protein
VGQRNKGYPEHIVRTIEGMYEDKLSAQVLDSE